jgi:hypothetical protein
VAGLVGEKSVDPSELKTLLAPFPSEEMTCWPVSPRVGNVKNNDPGLIEPIALGQAIILERAADGATARDRGGHTSARSASKTSYDTAAKQGLKGEPEYRLAFSLFRPERRQGDAQEPNAFRDGKERFEQRVAELFEFASRPDLHLTSAASRDLTEVGELDLERDCAAASTGALAVSPHLVDNLSKRITRGFVGEEIGGKRVLGADGFPYPIGTDRPLIDAARNPVIVRARFAEMLLQEGQGLRPEVESSLDPKSLHLTSRRRPDAVKLSDRQGLDEFRPHLGSDDEEPIRLAVIRGQFGEELVRRRRPMP